MWKRLHVKYTLFLSDFNESRIFSTDFRKKTYISNLIKIRPAGAELFHADEMGDEHDEVNSRFSQFFESARKCQHQKSWTYEAGNIPAKYNFLVAMTTELLFEVGTVRIKVTLLATQFESKLAYRLHSSTLQYLEVYIGLLT